MKQFLLAFVLVSGGVAFVHSPTAPTAIIEGTEEERTEEMAVCEDHGGIAQGLLLHVPGRVYGVECQDGYGDRISMGLN